MAKKKQQTMQFESLEKLLDAIKVFETYGMPIPQDLLEQKKTFEKAEQSLKVSTTPIYDTLKANAPFKPIDPRKLECIEQTVDKLLEDGHRAMEPCLLLGNIQCGKTDTFENIIGLCFDRGIDVCVVFTKGTKPLTQQTIRRMERDYAPFKSSNDLHQRATINIYDIMDIHRRGLQEAVVNRTKTVIVCKKQSTNLNHLQKLFTERNTFLQHKKVLVVDDEADFASRNYRAAKLNPLVDEEGRPLVQHRDKELAIIAQQIDDFRQIPSYCRYLQVTATPYCLYLQPEGELYLKGEHILSFRPRFTALVPTHSKYIGGKQYFEDSKDQNSMFSHLFHPVDQKCIDVLGKPDQRYITGGVSSAYIYDLTQALVSYMIATAIRRIQKRGEKESYKSSALVHVQIDKHNHEWQKKVVDRLVSDLKRVVVDEDNSDMRVLQAIDIAYSDFAESNRKGVDEGKINVYLPSKERILYELRDMFRKNDWHSQIVNSDEQVVSLLDPDTGELQLETAANIFIGGNILDRGITIKNMLCFFYGRNPRNFQQDTVLQHARMYGARDLADMAVTRFHTTEHIYHILARMNDLDNQLRQWFIDGKDQEEPNAVFIGFDKDIKPCSPQKIKASNTLTLKEHQRILPVGFWTGSRHEIESITKEIDKLIISAPNYGNADINGIFEIDKERAFEIIRKIGDTYRWDKTYDGYFNNFSHRNDIKELLCAIEHCTAKTNGRLFAMHRTGRDMSRIRENGAFVDAPDDGHNDTRPARDKAEEMPVLMLIRENGDKIRNEMNQNIGWNNAPFYWPVLMTQKNTPRVMYAIDQTGMTLSAVVDDSELISGINPDEILTMSYAGDLEEHFGKEGTVFNENKVAFESRILKDTTASKYIVKDASGQPVVKDSVMLDKDKYFGIYTYNNGLFPFVLRPYRYMLLHNGRSNNADSILLELCDPSSWIFEPRQDFNSDGDLIDAVSGDILFHGRFRHIDNNMNATEFDTKNICVWWIIYAIKRVVRLKKRQISGQK